MKTWLCVLTLLLLLDFMVDVSCVTYTFKRYTFKKKRDDKKYRNAKQVCDLKPECLSQYGVQQTACMRKCVSEFCYNELYGDDPLEEGEIDVRFNSFKGCLAQEKKMNNYDSAVNMNLY